MKTSLLTSLLLLCASLLVIADDLADAKAYYAAADKDLNTYYQKAKKVLPEYEFAEIKKSQLEWLERKKATEQRLASVKGSVRYWEELAYLTEGRAEYLNVRSSVKPKEGAWDGVYKDGHGGVLAITLHEPGTMYFEMTVVRGPSYHLGSISGTGPINNRAARYSDRGMVEEKETETWLNFLKSYDSSTVKVDGINTEHYHGARAFFDGVYYRVGDFHNILDSEESCSH